MYSLQLYGKQIKTLIQNFNSKFKLQIQVQSLNSKFKFQFEIQIIETAAIKFKI